jgi:flagellar M-ring protein FliF
VANIPFQDIASEAEMAGPPVWQSPILFSLSKNLLIGVSFLALILLVIRPMLNSLKAVGARNSSFEGIDEERLALEDSHTAAQLAMTKANQLEIIETVKKDPYQTAQVLQSWLKQGN